MTTPSIKSVAHNFIRSFMDYGNWIANGPVCESLYAIARSRHGAKIIIDWLNPEDSSKLPIDVEAAVDAHRRKLNVFLRRHDVERSSLSEFCAEVFRDAAHQVHVMCRVVDNRGSTHKFRVKV
jgi:hypothetical protein